MTDTRDFTTPLPLLDTDQDVSRNHYWSYHDLPGLLACKRPLTASMDEDLFIAVHQICEIAFHQIVIDQDRALDALRAAFSDEIGPLDETHYFLARVIRLWRSVNVTMPILTDLRAFAQFRTSIGPTSGFQSFQFRHIEIQAGVRERYWQGGTADAEGRLHVAETEFDRRYGAEVQDWLDRHRSHNLAYYWGCLREALQREPALAERADVRTHTGDLREIDRALVTFHKAHLNLAVEQLRRVGVDTGTGGTSFKQYLAKFEADVAPLFEGLPAGLTQ
jgi:tryptophan 2,3-dioxygenase